MTNTNTDISELREQLLQVTDRESLRFISIPTVEVTAANRKAARTVFSIIHQEGGEALFLETRTEQACEFHHVELIAKARVLGWALSNLEELSLTH